MCTKWLPKRKYYYNLAKWIWLKKAGSILNEAYWHSRDRHSWLTTIWSHGAQSLTKICQNIQSPACISLVMEVREFLAKSGWTLTPGGANDWNNFPTASTRWSSERLLNSVIMTMLLMDTSVWVLLSWNRGMGTAVCSGTWILVSKWFRVASGEGNFFIKYTKTL